MLVASTKLQALLVYVPDVLRGKVGVGIKDALQQAIEMFNICTVEILCAFWIQVAGPRKIELRMVLFELPEPVLAGDVTTQLEHEALDSMSLAPRPTAWTDGAWVRWGANRSPDADRWFAMMRYSKFVM